MQKDNSNECQAGAKKYTIAGSSNSTSLKLLLYPLLAALFFLSILSFSGELSFGDPLMVFTLLAVAVFIVVVLATMIPLLNYKKLNANDCFAYDENKRLFFYRHKDKELSFCLDDIESAEAFVGPGKLFQAPWNTFSHCIVQLKSGDSFVITNMLVPENEMEAFFSGKIERRSIFYRSGIGLEKYMRIGSSG